MKTLFTVALLAGLAACDSPTTVTGARENVEDAHENLAETRAEAAREVQEAKHEGAAAIAEAKEDVHEAEVELGKKLDAYDADLDTLEARALTPAQKDEVVSIRERHDKIVIRVRDHGKDGVQWSEIEREVNASVDELGRDIENAKIKITTDK